MYRYDWRTAGLPAVAQELLPLALHIAALQIRDGQFELVGAVLSWASSDHGTSTAAARSRIQQLAQVVRAIADDETAPTAARCATLLLLATCGTDATGLSDDARQARAQELLDSFPDGLDEVEHLQVLGTAVGTNADAVADRLPEFISLVRRLQARFEIAEPVAINPGWARGGMNSIIEPPTLALLRAGRVTEAVQLLAAWRGVPSEAELTRDPIIAIHDRADGLSWAVAGVAIHATPTGVDARDVLQAANQFLGTTVTTTTGDPIPLHVPERGRGVPEPSAAAAFLKAATSYLSLPDAQAARDNAEQTSKPASALIVSPTQLAPIQAIMLRELAWTLPLSMSLRAAPPDRPIRRALVWVGESFFAQRELDVLAAAFDDSAIDVVLRDEMEMTTAQFLADYCSDEFDLFWVGAHGQWDALDPESAYLLLPNDQRISLADLALDQTDAAARRLLVLNACDSATNVLMGGVAEIGLGTIAAGPAQAVIAHQWPIASPTVAPVFAGLLAAALANRAGYMDAYSSTVVTLASGPRRIREAIEVFPDWLGQLVDDHPEDFESMTGWASAVFLE